jgi:hypothetical protein
LIPNPIRKVLSTLSTHQVQYLLMGGQACVFYGAAEFSRDCDIAILCEPQNLARLEGALNELAAKVIAVPPFDETYLQRGHAVHFRCAASGVENIRVDVMARLRGVANFDELWPRRTTLEDDTGAIDLMALPDLVSAKKTQRDKDWPMIRRLIEASYAQNRDAPTPQQLQFWLSESRTPDMLIELTARFPEASQQAAEQRPLLAEAIAGRRRTVRQALAQEQEAEREEDANYWAPLKRELEQLRRDRR